MTTFEYVKMILEKVSFDKELFEKELKKAIKRLIPYERKELRKWCYDKFGSIYRGIINKVFRRSQVA
ncbi:MAG: hypothetical protein MUF45_09305 [Spirosomaceae bacterium]|jgi:hypothetical protein|nr:hypothetical protein [Spirosomataceae bacterium]